MKQSKCPVCGETNSIQIDDDKMQCEKCGWIDIGDNKSAREQKKLNKLSMEEFEYRFEYYCEKNKTYKFKNDGFPKIRNIKRMKCPVCGKTEFKPLRYLDLLLGDIPEDDYCPQCGWFYDEEQTSNPYLKRKTNEESLNEYRKAYIEKIHKDPNYSWVDEQAKNYVPKPHMCPVCGKYEFEDECCFDICPYCGWEDDGSEEHGVMGANDLLLEEYKKRYEKQIKENSKYKWERKV